LNEKFARNGREHADAVAALSVCSRGAAMRQPSEGGQGLLKNVMGGQAINGGYKPNSAGVMVEALVNKRWHRRGRGRGYRVRSRDEGAIPFHDSIYVQ
jgi:hypothetical protein